MKTEFDPHGILDPTGNLQGFLAGSIMVASFLVGMMAENELVILFMLAFIILGVLLFFASVMREGEEVFFFEDVGFTILGGIVAGVMSLFGIFILALYLIITVILAALMQTRSRWKR